MDRAVAGLDRRERAFARELAFGSVRLQGRLDHLLSPHVTGGLERLDAAVLPVLRMGLYQLLYLDVPDYAAVSQSVESTRAVGRGRASGLVNAVLRAAARSGDGADRFPDPTADPAGHLAAWGSHPRWLVDRWLARWSPEEVRDLVELNNRVPSLHLVPVAADDETTDALSAGAERLRREPGVRVELLEVPGVLRVEGMDPRHLLELVPGFIQDPGAALVCRYARPPRGGIVADLCAAPGGKALSLARRARYVLAADPSEPRLRLLRENVERLGLDVGVVRARAEQSPVRGGGADAPDLVLVDAPCTGTGTLGRHPDARWRLGPGAPDRMARIQGRILGGAAEVVPTGAILVYSTCTLEEEENLQVVEGFLRTHPDFRWAPPEDPELELNEGGWLEVLPQRTGFDGAFAARLVRTG